MADQCHQPAASMLKFFNQLWPWRPRKGLQHLNKVLFEEWCTTLPLLARLQASERASLYALANQFLALKHFEPAADYQVDVNGKQLIAIQACVPLLALDIGVYRGFRSIVVHADEFPPAGPYMDDIGVMHDNYDHVIGESWHHGPVFLSWSDVVHDAFTPGNTNVVLHEMAHQIDMLSGEANGNPPLHKSMDQQLWHEAMFSAYHDHCHLVRKGRHTVLDDYGAEDMAEFFAVACEGFFLQPDAFHDWHPHFYQLLVQLFRRDPQ